MHTDLEVRSRLWNSSVDIEAIGVSPVTGIYTVQSACHYVWESTRSKIFYARSLQVLVSLCCAVDTTYKPLPTYNQLLILNLTSRESSSRLIGRPTIICRKRCIHSIKFRMHPVHVQRSIIPTTKAQAWKFWQFHGNLGAFSRLTSSANARARISTGSEHEKATVKE
ncbi:hypothetical protein BKA93DRAFT_594889 [Sparassis latifolia]